MVEPFLDVEATFQEDPDQLTHSLYTCPDPIGQPPRLTGNPYPTYPDHQKAGLVSAGEGLNGREAGSHDGDKRTRNGRKGIHRGVSLQEAVG
jgi:hypothetical protein